MLLAQMPFLKRSTLILLRIQMSRLIRIHTVCHSVIDFDWKHLQQRTCPNSEVEESMQETPGVKELKSFSYTVCANWKHSFEYDYWFPSH